ncbi:MAG TPA: hypothetical protein VM406_12020 [Noviherbaspirillum sp.]|nr:hypothetical protein [Noviherbaspirillum sp.]
MTSSAKPGMPATPDSDRTMKQHQVRTGRPIHEDEAMRMPHERDESEDSQESEPRKVIKRAYDDLMEGQVDTDLRETGGLDAAVNERPGIPPEKVVGKGAT